jgi:hypothetical protein
MNEENTLAPSLILASISVLVIVGLIIFKKYGYLSRYTTLTCKKCGKQYSILTAQGGGGLCNECNAQAYVEGREVDPTKVVETMDEGKIVTKGISPTEPGKRITVSPLRQVLAFAAAAGAWLISSLVCSALTGGPTGFSETTAKVLPFIFAFFAYGAVAMAGRKDI